MALKRPDAIAFNKKNPIYPFQSSAGAGDSTSLSSLEFWSAKNDASMFVVGQTTKKKPHGLTFVRMFDGKVLDMTEVGVDSWVGMSDFKVCCLFNYQNRLLIPIPKQLDAQIDTRAQTSNALRL